MNEKTDFNMSATIQWSMFTVLLGFFLFFAFSAFLWLLWDLVAPVFLGLLLALLFRPLVQLTSGWNWPPWLTISLLLVILVLILTLLLFYFLPLLFEQIAQFIQSLPDYIESLLHTISGEEIKLDQEIRSRLSDTSQEPQKIITFLLSGTVKSIDIIIKTFGLVVYGVIYIILLVVFFVTFSLYLPALKTWLYAFLPHSHRDHLVKIGKEIYQASWTFLQTRLLIAVILSAFFSAGWAAAGVPYWLLLGSVTGLLNIIPYAAGLGWLIALLINGLEADTSILYALLWPTVVFAIGQALDGWVLTPLLQGQKLKIHPAIVLFATLAGGLLAGLLGMLLAIPLTASCQVIYAEVIKPSLIKWAKTH